MSGATNVDWEDVAFAGGDLFAADIGDNRARRPSVTIYRVPEPEPGAGAVRPSAVLQVRYPGGPADAEALVADGSDLYVLTKNWDGAGSRLLRLPRADGVAEDLGVTRIPRSELVTGASWRSGVVYVRTYLGVEAFAGPSVAAALRSAPCRLPSLPEPQGEAIAATATGYVTASEGASPALHAFRLDRPQLTSQASRRPARRRGPVGRYALVGAVVAGVIALRRRARRR